MEPRRRFLALRRGGSAPSGVGGDSDLRFPPMTTILTISGMRSVHCTRAVYTALGGVEGVERADVALGRATVEHDARATVDAMRAAVAMVGYEVTAAERSRGLPTL